MFKLLDITKEDLIAIKVDGKIVKNDYDKITPLLEKTIRDFGKIKLYIQIDSIDGIEPSAFREDVKTYIKYFHEFKKIAVVGENEWQKIWTNLANPFVSGTIKYFAQEEIVEAINWIME